MNKEIEILERLQFNIEESMLNYGSHSISGGQLRTAIISAIENHKNNKPIKKWIKVKTMDEYKEAKASDKSIAFLSGGGTMSRSQPGLFVNEIVDHIENGIVMALHTL